TREDYVSYLNADVSHPLCAGWTFRLDGQFAYNNSNLDLYDTHNTATLGDDNFIKDYFDYFSFLVKPSLRYTRKIGEGKDFVFTADYAFYLLHYPGRKSQNVSGVYQSEDEQDHQHTFSAKASYPLTKNISWVGYGSYTVADSNQEFESFYLY